MSQQPWNGPQGQGGSNLGPSNNNPGGFGQQGGFGGQPQQPQQSGGFGGPQGGYGNAPQQPGGAPQQPGFNGPQGQGGPQGPGYGGPQGNGPGGYGPQGPGGAPTKKKSKAPVIVAGVLGAGLLVGGGIFAYNFFSGGASPSAATAGIPSDALGVVELSLNPADADKLALRDIVNKFPGAEMAETDDYKEALWSVIPESEDKPDYAEDIEPWLGDSVSMGVVDNDGTPSPVLAVQTTDEDAAKAFFDEQLADSSTAEYFFQDDLLVLHEGTVTQEELSEGSLVDSTEYKEDMDALGGGNLATAWFSSAAVDLMLEEAASSGMPEADAANIDAIRGMHGALGLQVEDNMLSLEASIYSPTEVSGGENVRDFVDSLPDGAPLAFGGSFSEDAYAQLWEALGSTPDAQMQLEQFGITSQEDIQAVLGKQIALAVSGLDQQTPSIGVKVQTDDVERHQQILEPLTADLSAQGIETTVDGDTVIYTMGFSPDEVTGGGLGDNEVYDRVVSADGDAAAIMFVDLNAISSTLGPTLGQETAQYLDPVAGVGMVSTADGNRSNAHIRVAFN